MKICPKCKSASRHRKRRKPILKLIPGAKSYSCNTCHSEYTWFPIINRSLRV